MTTIVGIDLGTSGVKAVLTDGTQVIAEASRPIAVSVPHPGWSEQDPRLWVEARLPRRAGGRRSSGGGGGHRLVGADAGRRASGLGA